MTNINVNIMTVNKSMAANKPSVKESFSYQTDIIPAVGQYLNIEIATNQGPDVYYGYPETKFAEYRLEKKNAMGRIKLSLIVRKVILNSFVFLHRAETQIVIEVQDLENLKDSF